MSEESEEASQSPPAPETVTVVEVGTPTREMEPLKFFGPHGDPVGARDFRPTAIAFKDDDEDHPPVEDGHGNFRNRPTNTPTHPSVKRTPYPFQATDTEADEEQEAPEEGESKQDSPFGH